MLGIIGAMEGEVEGLKALMQGTEEHAIAGMRFIRGQLSGRPVVVVRSGIGKVNAAVCAAVLAQNFGVSAIVNTGIAGSLNADINIGDIVLSTRALQHDVDACVFGYQPGQIPQMPVLDFPGDPALIQAARRAAEKAGIKAGVHTGTVVSGDQFISSREKKEWLRGTFGGDCAEMEGAAIAQAAWLFGLPCLVIRSISDKADDSAGMDYESFEKLAIANSVALVTALAGEWTGA